MKFWPVGIAVIVGITLGGMGLSGSSSLTPPPPAVTAHAAVTTTTGIVVDSSVETPGFLGTCPWRLTADGVLHVESGTLPNGTNDNLQEQGFRGLLIAEMMSEHVVSVISLEGKIVAQEDASNLFADFVNSNTEDPDNYMPPLIQGWQNLDTSRSTNFSSMFRGYRQSPVDISGLNTDKAVNMEDMFSGVQEANGIEDLKTDNVTNMAGMFENYGDGETYVTSRTASLDLSKWHVGNVQAGGFARMFNVIGLDSLDLSNWEPKFPLARAFEGTASTQIRQITFSSKINLTDADLNDPDPDHSWEDVSSNYTGKWEKISDQYIVNPQTYFASEIMDKYNGTATSLNNETYIWEPKITPGNPVTVHYIDQNGKTIKADKKVPGDHGATYTITPDIISGYDYVDDPSISLTGTYGSEAQSVTLTYKKKPATSGATTTEPATDSSSTATSESSEADKPAATVPVARKDQAITAIKMIGLYRTPNFNKRTRIFYYAKQPRTKRPQFVIIGVAWSKNGVKRYLVRDVNHDTKRDGKTGYITANSAFTTHTYYQHNPKTVKVISRINGYHDKALTHQVMRFKPGKVLHVKKIVRHRLTTRLVLRDGTFITGNKVKLIMH